MLLCVAGLCSNHHERRLHLVGPDTTSWLHIDCLQSCRKIPQVKGKNPQIKGKDTSKTWTLKKRKFYEHKNARSKNFRTYPKLQLVEMNIINQKEKLSNTTISNIFSPSWPQKQQSRVFPVRFANSQDLTDTIRCHEKMIFFSLGNPDKSYEIRSTCSFHHALQFRKESSQLHPTRQPIVTRMKFRVYIHCASKFHTCLK